MPRDSRDRSPDSRDRGRSGSPKRGRSGSPKRDDRDRSGSPKRDRSGSRARSEERPRSEERREPSREREGVEIMKIDNDSAAFVLGRGGSTKRKIERVSETKMDLDERAGAIEIFGTDKQRQRARDYVNFVDQQRKGAVVIEVDDRDDVRPTAHRATPRTAAESGESKQLGRRRDGRCRPTCDPSESPPPRPPPRTLSVAATAQVTVVSVPEDCCGFVMGRQGATLRSMEEEVRPSVCCRACHTRALLCCCAGRGLRSIPSTAALTRHAHATAVGHAHVLCQGRRRLGASGEALHLRLVPRAPRRRAQGAATRETRILPSERRERSERVRVLPRSCVRVVELSGVPPPCV